MEYRSADLALDTESDSFEPLNLDALRSVTTTPYPESLTLDASLLDLDDGSSRICAFDLAQNLTSLIKQQVPVLADGLSNTIQDINALLPTVSGSQSSVTTSNGLDFGAALQTTNLFAALSVPGVASANVPAPNSPTTLYKYAGFIFFENDGTSLITADEMNGIKLLAKMGANTVDLWFNLFQQTATSSGLISNYVSNERLASLASAIDYAHSLGLQVVLKPTIAAADGTVTGGATVFPADPAAWFASYQQELVQYAQLAQQHHVDLFTIGTELLQLDRQPQYLPYWTDLISAVKQVYSGPLTYAAGSISDQNWSAPNGIAQYMPDKVSFWSQLSYIGVDAYPVLTTSAPTSAEQVAQGWSHDAFGNNWIGYLESLNAEFGKPVMLSEVGFPSWTNAYAQPASNIPDNAVPDYLQQELLLQGMYEALASLNATQFVGVTQWAEGAYPNDAASAPYINTPTGNGVFGKPSQYLMSSLYGAKDFIGWSDASFTGSIINDQICLFGGQFSSALQSANGATVDRAATFETTISITADTSIINGQTATIHLYVNGADYGAVTLQNTPSDYVDSLGVPGSADQTFMVNVPGLVNISQLKIAFDSPVNVGGPENSNAFIVALSVNGIALTSDTYFPLSGTPLSEQIADHTPAGTSSLFDGGYMTVDATPWNTALAASSNIGSATDPIQVNGGGGVDTVYVLGTPSEYTITGIGTQSINLSESSGLEQNALLTEITDISFQDGSIVTTVGTPATVAQEINGLYVTLYGLAATAAGVSFWENVLHNFDPGATPATAISVNDQTYLGQQMTAGSPIVNGTTYFATLYPASMSDMAFVQALYQNMSNFIGTAAGDNYWLGLLQQAEATNGGNVIAARESVAGQFVHDFLSNDLTVGAAALNVSQSDFTLLVNGQQALLNKAAISQYYANATATSGGSIINYTAVTDPAFTAAHNVEASITDDPTTESIAIAGINNAIAHQDLSLI